jgi:hypothetical protein
MDFPEDTCGGVAWGDDFLDEAAGTSDAGLVAWRDLDTALLLTEIAREALCDSRQVRTRSVSGWICRGNQSIIAWQDVVTLLDYAKTLA